MKDKYATITKEKLVNIIDNVFTDLEVDIDNDGDLADFEVEIIKRSINWFYTLLNDKISDYFDFEGGEK